MGRRPKAAYKATSDKGRSFGVSVTAGDKKRILLLARWYALSAGHIARTELRMDQWHPGLTGLTDGRGTDNYERRVYAIKRRLAKLARLDEAGTVSGPLVASLFMPGHETVWYPTLYGATAADVPWRLRTGVSPQYVAHAWMAADIALQIEGLGFRVLSEREHATMLDQYGATITTPIESVVQSRTGSKVTKKPDLAIISSDERSFIAVEAERDTNRALTTYMEKLSAYRLNTAVRAVWYICESPRAADRVREAANRVFGSSPFPLRVKVAQTWGTWCGIEDFTEQPTLMDDLRKLA